MKHSYCNCNDSFYGFGSFHKAEEQDDICVQCGHFVVYLSRDVPITKVSYALYNLTKEPDPRKPLNSGVIS
jgi:hypothetical protein